MGAITDSQVSLLLGAVGLYLLVIGSWTFYSVFLGPLSKFPGPKLAAATLWYEFYWDVVCWGQYTFKIKELHRQYGPIIRISPYELHIDEPDYYEELYSQHKPRDKSHFYVNQFGLYGSGFGTEDHRLHRMRRAALNPFFSKGAVARLQPMLHHMLAKLCGRIDELQKTGEPLPVRKAYMSFSTDVITLYALNRSWDRLDAPDFSTFWVETVKATVCAGHLMKQFPVLYDVINALPIWFVAKLNPGMGMLLQWQNKMQDETQEVIDGAYQFNPAQLSLGLNQTIFHALLESDLPADEKKHSRLWQEGLIVVGAGSDTVATTLTTIHFHLLDNPALLRSLRLELKGAMPDRLVLPELSIVEKLPFLNAVVLEGLRLSYGVSSRLQRSHPTEIMKFHDWEIPPRTPVGMTSVHIHHNETIFPDSHAFKPSRWLEPRPEGAPPLDRYLVSFSKGSRQCAGMNLAKAELYLTVATVFRRYEHQELYETTRLDVDIKHDMFMPQPDGRSKGVRVIFK